MAEMALISIDEALARYRDNIPRLPGECVPVELALGAVLDAPVHARTALPRFTQSSMDGYALRAGDGLAPRTIVGTSAAGRHVHLHLGPGETVRIFTGGVLPAGADAVARQEIVERTGETIRLTQTVSPGEAVRMRGEELLEGALLAKGGERVTAGLLAAFAMAGVAKLVVVRRPRVVVIITGDEVVRAGEPLCPGKIFDANGPLLRAWFIENGYKAPELVYVRDEEAALSRALDAALERAELVITSGGVSVGDRDFVPTAAARVGVRPIFWKVAQKPGKPLWFGMRNTSVLLGMPGNPAAVMACLTVHARAVLARLEGQADPLLGWRDGVLSGTVAADPERERLVRMRYHLRDGAVRLEDLDKQDSHMLSNLGVANALVRLPRRARAIGAGQVVAWLPL
jgi:molybdopterin molybdotransferase